MSARKLTVAALAVVVCVGVGVGVGRAAAARLPALLACDDSLRIRPTSIQVACGDGNFFLTNVRWSHWTATSAVASAVGHQDDCTPYCTHIYHRYKVELRLWRPRSCTGDRHLFTRFYIHFVEAKPFGPRSYTLKVPFYTGRGCS